MRHKRRKTKSLIGTLAIAGIISSSAYAFTASITVPSSNAGDGNTPIKLPRGNDDKTPDVPRKRQALTTPSSRSWLSTALIVTLLAAFWFFLAPKQLGGPATYVVTHGGSMAKAGYHSGDLAILHGSS